MQKQVGENACKITSLKPSS